MLKQTDQEERIREATSGSLAGSGAALNRPADLLQLTKPRITTMVLVSSAAGFVIASGGHPDPGLLLLTMVGIGLVAGGTSALNQLIERVVDARMERTRNPPLPTGRVTPRAAGFFSAAISLAGIGLLAVAVNTLTALLASIALLSYVLVYTPLKRVSSLSTLVGAIPGALPIMGGWTAARGELGPGAWALFGIMFFWQLPHFLALAWMFREDYQRGGLRMLGVTDPSGEQTRTQAVLYALALIPASEIAATEPEKAVAEEEQDESLGARSSRPPYALIIMMVVVVGLRFAGRGPLMTFFNVYLDDALGVSTVLIGALIAVGQFISVPAALAAPLGAARWGNGKMVSWGTVGVALSMVPLALIPQWWAAGAGFVGAIAMFSVSTGPIRVYSQDLVTRRWWGVMSGAVMMGSGLGIAVMTLIGGYAVAALGYQVLFLAGAGLVMAGAVIFWAYFRVPRGELAHKPQRHPTA